MSDAETPREALERRIREARAKTSAFEESGSEREQLRELERRARTEENRARDLPHVQEAEDEHKVIRVVNTPLGAIVVRRPHHLAFQQFMRKAGSEKGMDEAAIWRLVKPCVVYPDVARVEEITEEYPGVTVRLGNAVVELGNGVVEDAEGK
jgi:hypothetical protein